MFKLGLKDMGDYERTIKAKWDWFEDMIVTISEWSTWLSCNNQVFSTTPLLVIFSDLDDNLWSWKSLSVIALALVNPMV